MSDNYTAANINSNVNIFTANNITRSKITSNGIYNTGPINTAIFSRNNITASNIYTTGNINISSDTYNTGITNNTAGIIIFTSNTSKFSTSDSCTNTNRTSYTSAINTSYTSNHTTSTRAPGPLGPWPWPFGPVALCIGPDGPLRALRPLFWY